MSRVFMDSFSGDAASLPPKLRSKSDVLAALSKSPCVSTWDMSEYPWLRNAIRSLIASGQLIEDKSEPYPWHRFIVRPPAEAERDKEPK